MTEKVWVTTMKIKDALEIIGNGSMYVLTAVTPEKLLSLINLGLSILISIVILVTKLVSWWKDAKKDGKVTKEEIKQGVDIITSGVDEIKENIERNNKNENKK